MSLLDTSPSFDTYYYAHGCGDLPYERNEDWLRFFGAIADCIVRDVQPRSVLDAGCAIGLLVESLRSKGVEAFGVDISEYALQQVHSSIRPYCWVGSVTEAFPQKYDLIVCIEVLEHMLPHEAESAIANFCQHADDVLFSSSPLDYKEATHFNVRPPEYWAEQFARHGFFHDVDFDASFITPWTVRFRKAREPATRVIASYERRLWQLEQENRARRELNIEQRTELAQQEGAVQTLAVQEQELQYLRAQLKAWQTQWATIESSPAGKLMLGLQNLRARLAPPGSSRDQMLGIVFRELFGHKNTPDRAGQTIQVEPLQPRPPIQAHVSSVDIIICVHNALDDVQHCLESIVRHTSQPYSIILVDDGSDAPTRDYLSGFAGAQGATLIRNEQARGYTRAANQGLHRSLADYVVLLNSDTILTPEWLDRMIACAESDSRVGIIGPLSNTASWQSIPDIEAQGDWAANPLPDGMTVEEMAALVTRHSARSYPHMPLLNGFCLMIRRALIREIGYLDEENFGPGYGEEDDYVLRARKAGWSAALADDTYIFHAQSRSYSHETRKKLSGQAGRLLAQKHGQLVINEGVTFCRQDRTLDGIRARSRAMLARREWIQKGRDRFEGKRVLFVLPINEPGGGGNVVIDETLAMRQMGVDVHIFNLREHQSRFESAYPALEIPVLYGERKHLANWANEYDAVIATYNISVEWLAPIVRKNNCPIRGYYVQGFEPYMYQPGTADYQKALESYSLFPDLVRFTKTEWTRQEVTKYAGVDCALVGASVSIDLFRPRPRPGPEWPDRPLRIAAMIRPQAHYRGPKLTMELFRKASRRYGNTVDLVIFGTAADGRGFSDMPRNFPWKLAGEIHQKQVARLLNEVDIFVDFSSHQAMGLTALEAMACGAAVIVPARGGAVDFARHGENSLVVDTSSSRACWRALQRLIQDHDLRVRLQRNALIDTCDLYPERPAFNILDALFGSQV